MRRKLAKRICRVLDDMQSAFDSEDPGDGWKVLAVDVGYGVAFVGLFAVAQLSFDWYPETGMVEGMLRVIGGEAVAITVGILAGALMWRRGKSRKCR